MSISEHLIRGLLLACILTKEIAAKRQAICVSPRQEERDVTLIEIGCKRKHVISHMTVSASNMSDCGAFEGSCTGRSPDLIMHSNLCLWKESCTIPFPNMKIVTSDIPDKACFYETPESTQVSDVRCVKQRDMSTMCDEKPIKSKSKGGIIRSHEEAPWFYDNEALFQDDAMCQKTLLLSSMLRRKMQLAVEVRVFAICETEKLELRPSKGDTIIIEKDSGSTTHVFSKQQGELSIEFSGSTDSCGCEGFVICYKVYKNDKAVKMNVCEDLSKPASLLAERNTKTDPITATSKKQRGKGRRRKSKGN